MKKGQFQITWHDHTKRTVSGYILHREGIDFGVHKLKSLINSDIFWIVTELFTGLKYPFNYKTRKEAIQGIEAYLPKTKEIVKELKTA